MSYPQQPPRLLPPHYLALSLAAMLGLYALSTSFLQSPPLLAGQWRLTGLAPLLAGLLFAVQGSRKFSAADTNIVPFTQATSLVTSGVFSVSRNPMYAGMILFLTGVAVLLNQWAPWAAVVAFGLLLRYGFIGREEAQMRATFGNEYEQYCARTNRWFGRK